MELTITSALALFTLIILSTFVYFIARRLKAPYTVLLVLVGLLLVPVANAPYVGSVLGFIDDMVLTPELLFFIFLPILIFSFCINKSSKGGEPRAPDRRRVSLPPQPKAAYGAS